MLGSFVRKLMEPHSWLNKNLEADKRLLAVSRATTGFLLEFNRRRGLFPSLQSPFSTAILKLNEYTYDVGAFIRERMTGMSVERPIPPPEDRPALCQELERLWEAGSDVSAWFDDFSRILQNAVLHDVTGNEVPCRKPANPETLILSEDGSLKTARELGMVDPNTEWPPPEGIERMFGVYAGRTPPSQVKREK